MARYRMRALMAASSIGLLIGASAGAAYLGGRLAKDATAANQTARLMQMAEMNNGDTTVSAALGTRPLNDSALTIASRFAPYGANPGANAQAAQALTALRTTTDVRLQRVQVTHVNYMVDATPLRSTPLLSDHPVRAAAAMIFKAHSQNDSDCLTQAVYYEARGEGEDGMRAVAQVILNRVRHPAFPKTICGVVYQGAYHGISCQFSFVCNGAMAGPVEAWAWRRAKDVASAALNGYVMKTVGTATHFHTTTVDPVWSATMVQVATVGGHTFYQFRGRGSHIDNGLNGVTPSSDVPMLQAAADRTTADGTPAVVAAPETAPAQVVTIAAATPVTQPAAGNAELVNALQRMDTTKIDTAAKPVQLSAKITGKPAEAVVAAVSKKGPVNAPASLIPSPPRP